MKSGVLLLNKPTGPSSARALYPVKRVFRDSKVGHTGTLDPFASGLLVLMIGNATRLSRWFTGLDKQYEAVLRFGIRTDTLDSEGAVIARCDPPPRTKIEATLPEFIGEILQVPPVYSALKIGGRRAYELARSGSPIEPEARPVTIHEILLGAELDRTDRTIDYELEVHCGSGTYVRSLARDIGIAAGSCASLVDLKRTAVGPFRLEDAPETTEPGSIEESLVPLATAVKRLGCAEIRRVDDASVVARLRNGAQPEESRCREIAPEEGRLCLFTDSHGTEVAIGRRVGSRIVYDAVFPQAKNR